MTKIYYNTVAPFCIIYSRLLFKKKSLLLTCFESLNMFHFLRRTIENWFRFYPWFVAVNPVLWFIFIVMRCIVYLKCLIFYFWLIFPWIIKLIKLTYQFIIFNHLLDRTIQIQAKIHLYRNYFVKSVTDNCLLWHYYHVNSWFQLAFFLALRKILLLKKDMRDGQQ